ncbi:hypothetical protein ACFV0L_15960 [Streptosporangium canum]|uniref:hypothetical protein n=1 Tax=Streptosporangium canum TaxID=324952 RepID=UPI00368E0553
MRAHPRIAMQILRHSQISVTMNIYSEVSQPEAEEVARALRAGHVLPDFPMLEEDLSVRVRDLVADDHRKEAVFLIRREEKMRQRAAEAFVDSGAPGPHA